MINTNVAPEALNAFKSAVKDYKPWQNNGAWNERQGNPFRDIINGGVMHGILVAETAHDLFNVSAQKFQEWQNGKDIPVRKERLKVWKTLKKELGLKQPSN